MKRSMVSRFSEQFIDNRYDDLLLYECQGTLLPARRQR